MPDQAPRYDVFLSHNSADKAAVEEIARRLIAAGLQPFLDKWHLIPGQPWMEGLENALADSASAAIFVGPSGISPWHNEEMRAALDEAVRTRDDYRVIPVLLPGADETAVARFLARRTWVDFRVGLDDAEAFQRLVAGIQGQAIDIGPYRLPDEPAPYRGLLPFEVEHARFFFGRDADIARLVEKLGRQPFVAVVGASGSGKSSLVKAGLLPRLKANALTDSRRWHVLTMTPGSQPLRSLANQLATFVSPVDRPAAADKLTSRLAERPDGLRTALNAFLADRPHPGLLFIDQFEELFTLCADGPERCRMAAEQFSANLADAAERGDGQIRVILTLRADFLDRCLAYPALRKLLESGQLLLGPLSEADLRDAIVRPAQQVGAMLEKGLVNTILADVSDEPGSLPLLQHALHELWLARRGPWLTLDAYEASGGVAGALGRRAQATYAALSPELQTIARNILLRLATLGEGVSDTRRRTDRAELYPVGVHPAQVDIVIQALSGPDARLLVADEDTVEMAHEALIHGWSVLRGWLEASREALRTHRRLTEAAEEWARDRDGSYLYRGARLAEAEEWATAHSGEMNAQEAAFVKASMALRDLEKAEQEARQQRELEHQRALAQEQRQRADAQARAAGQLRRRAAYLAIALLVAIIAAGGAGISFKGARDAQRSETQARQAAQTEVAVRGTAQAEAQANAALASTRQAQALANAGLAATREAEARAAQATAEFSRALEAEARRSALDERNRAEEQAHLARSRELVTHAQVAWPANPQRSLLLGIAALRETLDAGAASLPAAEDVVRQALTAFSGHTLGGHQGVVTVAVISPDGRWMASGGGNLFGQTGDDPNLHWWDLAAPDPAVAHQAIPLGEGFLLGAGFSPDGHWLLGVTVEKGDNPMHLVGHRWEVTASGLQPTSWPPLPDQPLWPVAFSADSRWLVGSAGGDLVGDWSAGLVLWDLSAATPVSSTLPLTGLQKVFPVFDPDQRWLVAATSDGRLQLWDLTLLNPATLPISLAGPGAKVEEIALGRDSPWLAARRADGTVQVWNLADPQAPPAPLPDGIGKVHKLALSSDGRWLVAGSDDGRVRLWRLEEAGPISPSLSLPGEYYGSVQMAVSSDSRWLALAADATPHLWNLTAADPAAAELVLTGHQANVSQLLITQDSRRLVTVSADQTIRIWDLTAPLPSKDPAILHSLDASGWLLGLSQTARWLAIRYGLGMVQLHDLTQPLPVQSGTLHSPHRAQIESFWLTPDGRWLVTTDDFDGRLWDLSNPAVPPRVITTFTLFPRPPQLSPDGRWLIAEGADHTIYRWDMHAADPAASVQKLSDPIGALQEIHIDRNGQEVAALTTDAKLYRWSLAEPDRPPAVRVLPGGDSNVGGSRISPDNRWVVMGFRVPALFIGAAKQTLLWDTAVSAAGADPYDVKAEDSATTAVAFSADSRTLFTASANGLVRAWNLAAPDPTAGPRMFRGNPYIVTALAASPDGRWLVAGTGSPLLLGDYDYSVRVWDLGLADPEAPPLILRGHSSAISALALSSDGRWLATGDRSATLRLWDLTAAQPNATVRLLPGHASGVTHLAFSADSLTLISAGGDTIIRFAPLRAGALLDSACRAVGRNLSTEEWQRYFPGEDYRPTCDQWPEALW